MINTREKYEDNVGYDRSQERRFAYNDNDRAYDNNRHNSNSRNERVNNNDTYRNVYENVNTNNRSNNMYNDDYSNSLARPESNYDNDNRYVNNYNNDNRSQFAPIDMSEVMSDSDMARSKKSKKSKAASKISMKSKLCIAIYFALVALIVAMLLVNAIPSVGAQESASQNVVINNEGYDSAMDSVLNSGSVVVVPPYNYDTTTNWFDDFCDYMGGLFS